MKVPMAPCWQLSLPVCWGFAFLISHSHCLLDSWGMLSSSWQLSSFLEFWSDLALIMYPTFSVFIWCKGKKKEENVGSLGWSHKSSWLYLHSLTHLRPSVSLWRVLWRGIGHKETKGGLGNIHCNQRFSAQWLVTTGILLRFFLSQASGREHSPEPAWSQTCILRQRHTDKLCLCCMAISPKWEHSFPEGSI